MIIEHNQCYLPQDVSVSFLLTIFKSISILSLGVEAVIDNYTSIGRTITIHDYHQHCMCMTTWLYTWQHLSWKFRGLEEASIYENKSFKATKCVTNYMYTVHVYCSYLSNTTCYTWARDNNTNTYIIVIHVIQVCWERECHPCIMSCD